MASPERQILRRRLRRQRRDVTAEQQRLVAEAVRDHIRILPAYLNSHKLAVYLQNDGEVDLSPMVADARHRGKEIYLPVVDKPEPDDMSFAHWRANSRLVENRYGIPEPDCEPLLPVSDLDLVLAPLIAFDAAGTRIGMGGGYYDRCFAFLKERNKRGPKLIGVAYTFQEVEALSAEPWDIPLWCVVTEDGVRRFSIKD